MHHFILNWHEKGLTVTIWWDTKNGPNGTAGYQIWLFERKMARLNWQGQIKERHCFLNKRAKSLSGNISKVVLVLMSTLCKVWVIMDRYDGKNLSSSCLSQVQISDHHVKRGHPSKTGQKILRADPPFPWSKTAMSHDLDFYALKT